MDISNTVTDNASPARAAAAPAATGAKPRNSADFAALLALGTNEAEQAGTARGAAPEAPAAAIGESAGKRAGKILPELTGTGSSDTNQLAAESSEGEMPPADPALAVPTLAAQQIEIVLAPPWLPANAETGEHAVPDEGPARSARNPATNPLALLASADAPRRSPQGDPAGAGPIVAPVASPDSVAAPAPRQSGEPAASALRAPSPAIAAESPPRAANPSAAAAAAARTIIAAPDAPQGRRPMSASPVQAVRAEPTAGSAGETDASPALPGKPAVRQPQAAPASPRPAELGADLSASRAASLAIFRAGPPAGRQADSLPEVPASLNLAAPFAPPAAQPANPGAMIAAAPPQVAAAHDFQAIVERLSEAREAASPQVVAAALSHQEFGRVSLSFRQDERTLAVAMSSTDPGFAPAVQAAAASAGAQMGQTGQDNAGTPARQETGPRHETAGQAGASPQAGMGQGQTAGQSSSQPGAQGAPRGDAGQSGARTRGQSGQDPQSGAETTDRADRRDIYA